MGVAENRAKSAAQAAYMKERGIKRTSGACPWGCGAQIPNGGEQLITHLGRCIGGASAKRLRASSGVRNRRGR